MIRLPEFSLGLRDWQIQAFGRFAKLNEKDFFLIATPGAGKTRFALKAMHWLLQSTIVDQIVIVCPTEALKKQWGDKAHEIGIDIDPYYESGRFNNKYHGVAVTYSAVGRSPDLYRLLCQRNTLAVLDEPHHCGDQLSWGDGVKFAFEPCVKRLFLTGTPNRTDHRPIPFFNYENGLRVESNHNTFKYTYREALRDRACRYVFFPAYEGTMEWISGVTGEIRTATFADDLDEREISERLNTAIDPKGAWLRQIIADAHQRLLDDRQNGHTDAGGLIVAKDIKHAESIKKLVIELTGTTPVLVTSDAVEADKLIEDYAASSIHWIVAVRMVSEGIDIPRLRVGIYATNIMTRLYFHQFVGRFVRVISDLDEQVSSIYIPDEPILAEYAHQIADERDTEIRENTSDPYEPADEYVDPRTGVKESIPSAFQPISAEPVFSGTIIDQTRLSITEIQEAAQIARETGLHNVQPEVLANALKRYMERHGAAQSQKQQEAAQEPAKYRRLGKLKDKVTALVNRYAAISGKKHNDIHTEWHDLGNKWQRQADEDDLKRKIEWLQAEIKSAIETRKSS